MAKSAIRRQVLEARNRLDFSSRETLNSAILQSMQELPEISGASCIFTYVSLGTEPDTHHLIDWMQRQGKQVCIPKILNDHIIAVDFPGWAHLHAGPYGIPEPDDSMDRSDKVDVCLIPGVSFDKNGNRLGHGGGYYDKWLDQYTVSSVIAPAFNCQIQDVIPVDGNDKKVDIIITESAVIRP